MNLIDIISAQGAGNPNLARIARLSSDPSVLARFGQDFNARFEDPEMKLALDERQNEVEGRRFLSLGPDAVHIPTGLPNMLLGYVNRDMIADEIAPIVQVAKRSDQIWELPAANLQQLAETEIASQRARPNEVNYALNHDRSYAVRDYGLIDFIPADEENNADAPLQPRLISADVITGILDLAREYRVATLATTAANYGTNTTALTGTNRWDNDASDPVKEIRVRLEQVFSTPNVFFCGGEVWPKLSSNPNVLKYILSRAGTRSGAVPDTVAAAYFAELIGVEKVVIGRAKVRTTREGAATPASGYLWGKSAGLLRVERQPNPRKTATAFYTYRYGSRAYLNQTIPEILHGVRGGTWLKLTHSDAEQAVGGVNTGFFWDTVIS